MKKYKIENVDCPNCALKIERAVMDLNVVKDVSINFATSRMLLDTTDLKKVKEAIETTEPGVTISELGSARPTPSKTSFIPLILSILLFIGGFVANSLTDNEWISYFLFIPAYLISGWKVIYKGTVDIFKKRLFDENFLMTIATLGAIVIREPAEAAGVMLFYKIGQILQDISIERSRRSIESLLELKEEAAHLVTEKGLVKTDIEKINPGDQVVVKPGEKVPLDGIILSGSSRVDTSALTGESVPSSLGEKDDILAGMINKTHTLTIEVTKRVEDSSVAKILDLVENALHKKTKTEQFITRFARVYTPIVVAAALLVAVVPPLFIPAISFSDSIYRALVLLVISCPCALVLSIPLGYFIGIGRASKEGILIKGSNYLDLLTETKTVVFDKTGTLTEGVFKVNKVVPSEDSNEKELLEKAALAESQSTHPIALSILEHYGRTPHITFDHYEEVSGFGIVATREETKILAGNDALLHRENIPHEHCVNNGTLVHVAVNGTYLGYIAISDKIKEDARPLSDDLKKMGIKQTIMLTGDNEEAAEKTARTLKLDGYFASLLPEDKINRLEELESKDHKTIFVGDGINDAPIIARADVGIAIGPTGSDAAIDVADIVITKVSKLKRAFQIAKKTRRTMRQNIVFVIAVKILFIAFGAAGLAGMWAAVFADMGVSLLAVLNSLRIHRK